MERIPAALVHSSVGLAVTDVTGRFVAVNRAFCRITKYSENELLARDWISITHPDDRERNQLLAQPLVRGSISNFIIEKRYITKDGSTVWVRNSTSSLLDRSGKTRNFIALVEDLTERKRVEKALREVSTRLMHTQDEERRRLARELHDSTGQTLAALVMTLGSLKDKVLNLDPEFRRTYSNSLKLAKHSAREVRTLAYLLHPPMLDEFGLTDALRWYVRGFTQRSGIRVTLHFPDDIGRLTADAETTLFRIVQEGLNNVLQHSGSKRAAIRVLRRDNCVFMEIQDFGRGLKSAGSKAAPQKPIGVGIPGMKERLKQFGGGLEVRFTPKGTRLTALLPLEGNTG